MAGFSQNPFIKALVCAYNSVCCVHFIYVYTVNITEKNERVYEQTILQACFICFIPFNL